MIEKKKRGIQDIAIKRTDIVWIDPRELDVRPGWNARETDFDAADEADLALARSIADGGVREPITAVMDNGHVYVTNGHRRRAATLYAIKTLGADIKSVPVQTEPRYSSEAEHVLSQIVRNSGKPLTSAEKGTVFKRLLGLGYALPDIATKTGLTSTWITHCLELHAAPEPIKAMIRDGLVSGSFAMQAIRESDGDTVKATDVLQGAVETARAAGKTRATPRHAERAGPPKVSLKVTLRDAIAASSVDQPEDGPVVITMPAEQFARVREAFGLVPRRPEFPR